MVVPAEGEQHGETARHARQCRQQRSGLQELRPLGEGVRSQQRGDLHAAHEGEARLEAVEPDEGEVAAHDGQRQVLHEDGEAQPARQHEREAEEQRRRGECHQHGGHAHLLTVVGGGVGEIRGHLR